jgi:predicted transcriptional regulator
MKITKQQLKRIIMEEKQKLIKEMNSDGSVSMDEDARRVKMLANVSDRIHDLTQYIFDESEEIGGGFRSPGIRKQAFDLMANKIREVR